MCKLKCYNTKKTIIYYSKNTTLGLYNTDCFTNTTLDLYNTKKVVFMTIQRQNIELGNCHKIITNFKMCQTKSSLR